MNTTPRAPTLTLALDWSPEQALAVWQLLHELSELIWARYELALLELLREDYLEDGDPHGQRDLFQPPSPATGDPF